MGRLDHVLKVRVSRDMRLFRGGQVWGRPR